jgi:hypothetical protein
MEIANREELEVAVAVAAVMRLVKHVVKAVQPEEILRRQEAGAEVDAAVRKKQWEKVLEQRDVFFSAANE